MANALAVRGPRGTLARPARTGLVVTGAVLVALCWLIAQGVSPLVVLVVAALPVVFALGHRYAFALLVAVLVIRPLVDNAGLFGVNAGIGVVVIALGALVALYDVRAFVLLLAGSVPLAAAAYGGLPRWGDDAWQEGLRLISVIALFAVALVAPTIVRRPTVARIVQVAGLVPAVVAIVQAVTGTGTTIADVARSSGTLSQANPAAHFFGLCAVVSLARVVEVRSTRRWDLAALGLFVVAVLTTGSVAGLLTLVAALLAYTALAYGLRSIPMVVGVASVALIVVIALLSPVGRGRLAELTATGGATDAGNSVTWRFTAWGKIYDAWQESPFTGNGLGATLPGGVLETNVGHNEYLWLLTEMGLLGAIAAAIALIAYVWGMARFRRRGASPLNLALAGGVMLGTAVNAASDNPMHFTPSLFVLAFLMATMWRISSREAAAATPAVLPATTSADAAPHAVARPVVPAPRAAGTAVPELTPAG